MGLTQGSDGTGYIDEAMSLHTKGEYDKAIKTYDKAIKLGVNLERAWVGKGNSILMIKDEKTKSERLDKALECYKAVLEINPKNQAAKRNKINVEKSISKEREKSGSAAYPI